MSIIDGLKLDELQERNSNDKANIVTPGEKICEIPNSPRFAPRKCRTRPSLISIKYYRTESV
jgi:hypothetical protein